MEPVYPMVISAIAVLITLVYASYLDIRDRRVPFIHWLPMLAVGVCCTGLILREMSGDTGIIAGYASLVASFLYADYLDNRGRTDSLGLTSYYRKDAVFWYLALVLILAALAWLLFVPAITIPMVVLFAAFAGILGSVTWMEYTGRFDEPEGSDQTPGEARVLEIIGRWYFIPVILIIVIAAASLISSGIWRPDAGLSSPLALSHQQPIIADLPAR